MRRRASTRARGNVCALITTELTGLEATARERGVSLVIGQCARTSPACSNFYADPLRVGQIVKNVVFNAIR